MTNRLLIPELGAKIELLLRSDKTEIKTNNQLCQKMNVGHDYLSRLKNGTRTLTEENFLKLCTIFKLLQKVWYEELESFGDRLGFSRKQIAIITQRPLPGIDFSTRIKDTRLILDTFKVIEGYWESFYYSVSSVDDVRISRDLCVMKSVNEDGFIECDIVDPQFTYTGWCFLSKSNLYFAVEKESLKNEIAFYITNMPDRWPPRLSGIISCISSGQNTIHSYPSAAKIVFRYLGKNIQELRRKYKVDPSEDIDKYLRKNIPSLIDPEKKPDDLFKDIENTLLKSQRPLALRMDK
jgi:transcriptional regulator with XRE-family HTH domain